MIRKTWALSLVAVLCGAAFAAVKEPPSKPVKGEPFELKPATESAVSLKRSLEFERYNFARRNRRDPFRPALTPMAAGEEAQGRDQLKYYSPEEQEQKYAMAQDLAKNIGQASAQQDHAEVVRLYKELSDITLRRFTNEAYRQQVEKFQTGLFPVFQRSQVIMVTSQAEKLVSSMEDLLSRDKYDKVLQYAGEIESLVVSAEITSPTLQQQLSDLMLKATELRRRAEARQEFAQMALKISGIAWSPESPAAIVNGKTVKPGEQISPDLKVAGISEQSVTFDYKGEKISRDLTSIGSK